MSQPEIYNDLGRLAQMNHFCVCLWVMGLSLEILLGWRLLVRFTICVGLTNDKYLITYALQNTSIYKQQQLTCVCMISTEKVSISSELIYVKYTETSPLGAKAGIENINTSPVFYAVIVILDKEKQVETLYYECSCPNAVEFQHCFNGAITIIPKWACFCYSFLSRITFQLILKYVHVMA